MTDTNILFHSECDFSLDKSSEFTTWLQDSIQKEGKEAGALNYVFCTDEYLLEKNIQFLDHDTYTDIITFDYCEGKIVNGDLFISIERVRENAAKFKVDFTAELARVIIHGTLHLLGYKDKTEEEQKEMRSKEDFYLSLRA
jgi:probable rRNA maturation factor